MKYPGQHSSVPIFLSETDGNPANSIVYVKNPDRNEILRLNSSLNPKKEAYLHIYETLKNIFLPDGYPATVSDDYASYQIWDTVQACASTISGTLATKAVLQSVGVGNSEASAMSAAVTWVLKDGAGMLSRILFAWVVGTGLDADCKKWRLFADIVNDIAMCIEVSLLPFYPSCSLQILCISSSLKALVGVAGGATRSAITQHQAVNQNMADVSAKDGSQETFVNLITSFLGLGILSFFSDGKALWIIFGVMTILHLYSNYKAVQCLNFPFFNERRLALTILEFFNTDEVPSSQEINCKESEHFFGALHGQKLSKHSIVMGKSLKGLSASCTTLPFQFQFLIHLYKERKYLILVDTKKKTVFVGLAKDHTPTDTIEAYFHAVLQGLGSIMVHSNEASWQSIPVLKGPLSPASVIGKLQSIIKSRSTSDMRSEVDLPLLMLIDQFASRSYQEFVNGATNQGWDLSRTLLPIDKWRIEWEEENNLEVESFKVKGN